MADMGNHHFGTTVKITGGNVVVPNPTPIAIAPKQWFVAIVQPNTEKKCSERLTKMGVENYVAIQQELHLWSQGRKRMVDRVVIPHYVFVHVTEQERLQIIKYPFLFRYLVDPCSAKDEFGKRRPAVIDDESMQKLMFMLGHADSPVRLADAPFHKGDKVSVIAGPLRGMTGYVESDSNGQSTFYISLDALGAAKVQIDSNHLEGVN